MESKHNEHYTPPISNEDLSARLLTLETTAEKASKRLGFFSPIEEL